MDQSGAERQLWLLATNLPSDFEVQVIALNRGGFFAERLRAAGIHVEVLQKRFRFDPLTWWRLRRILKRDRPDVVQSFLFAANSYVRLPGVCPSQTKIVVSERCVDSWKSGWQLKVDRWLKDRMQAMTANSESVAEFYRATVGVADDQLTVIPNGVPVLQDSPPDDRGLRCKLGLPPDARLVGFVGRLAAQKCLKDLIWGFHLLMSSTQNVFLILVGDGDGVTRDELAEFATSLGCRDLVHFLGHRTDAAEITGQLTAFCLPSSFEGMSNSLMDAMSMGVPVVVSDIPANLELIEHEVTGLVFEQGQGPKIGMALKRLIDDRDFADRLGAAAKVRILQQHSIQQMVDRHVDLYRRLCHS